MPRDLWWSKGDVSYVRGTPVWRAQMGLGQCSSVPLAATLTTGVQGSLEIKDTNRP